MSEHNCDCGCGHDHEHNHEEEWKVTLTLDNDEEMVCTVLTIFEAGEHDYIALLPDQDEDEEEAEVYLYRYSETEDEEPVLDSIESDEEYNAAAEVFYEIMESAESEELVDDEE